MKLNFYDILFYSIYNVMRRQGNPDPQDDKLDGLIGGAIFLPLIPGFIYLDVAIILKHFSPVSILPNKIILIIIGCVLVIINFLLFKRKNRYLAIHEYFELMDKSQRKKYLISVWSFVLILLVVFFSFVYMRFTTY
jgi:hypothetical protein